MTSERPENALRSTKTGREIGQEAIQRPRVATEIGQVAIQRPREIGHTEAKTGPRDGHREATERATLLGKHL